LAMLAPHLFSLDSSLRCIAPECGAAAPASGPVSAAADRGGSSAGGGMGSASPRLERLAPCALPRAPRQTSPTRPIVRGICPFPPFDANWRSHHEGVSSAASVQPICQTARTHACASVALCLAPAGAARRRARELFFETAQVALHGVAVIEQRSEQAAAVLFGAL